jgi:hypothetical protein
MYNFTGQFCVHHVQYKYTENNIKNIKNSIRNPGYGVARRLQHIFAK